MTWNLPKIREACLELIGWDITETWSDMDQKMVPSWLEPTIGGHTDPMEAPDPTTSLDDALPLMKLCGCKKSLRWSPNDLKWDAGCPNHGGVMDENPAFAVAVSSLICLGRDLEEFQE